MITFDILESYHFQKYGICWVFQSFCLCLCDCKTVMPYSYLSIYIHCMCHELSEYVWLIGYVGLWSIGSDFKGSSVEKLEWWRTDTHRQSISTYRLSEWKLFWALTKLPLTSVHNFGKVLEWGPFLDSDNLWECHNNKSNLDNAQKKGFSSSDNIP